MLIELNVVLESKITFRALGMMVPVVASKLLFVFEPLFALMALHVGDRNHVVLIPQSIIFEPKLAFQASGMAGPVVVITLLVTVEP